MLLKNLPIIKKTCIVQQDINGEINRTTANTNEYLAYTVIDTKIVQLPCPKVMQWAIDMKFNMKKLQDHPDVFYTEAFYSIVFAIINDISIPESNKIAEISGTWLKLVATYENKETVIIYLRVFSN